MFLPFFAYFFPIVFFCPPPQKKKNNGPKKAPSKLPLKTNRGFYPLGLSVPSVQTFGPIRVFKVETTKWSWRPSARSQGGCHSQKKVWRFMAGAMINHIFFMGVAIRHGSFSGGIYIFRGNNIKLELLFHDPKRLSIGEDMIQVGWEMILF